MENTKHTPGPWKFDGLTFIRSSLPISSSFSKIASICDGHRGPHEATANAKLIAAAPDLLQACIDMVSFLENNNIGHAQVLLDAIKKATQ